MQIKDLTEMTIFKQYIQTTPPEWSKFVCKCNLNFIYFMIWGLSQKLPSFFSALKCYAVLSGSAYVWLFVTPCTVAHQAPLFMGILQARILEWVVMPSSRGSYWPRDQTLIPLLHWHAGSFTTDITWKSQSNNTKWYNHLEKLSVS